MIPGDRIQADIERTDTDAPTTHESAGKVYEPQETDAESIDDEAWLNACRQELEDDDAPLGNSDDTTNDPDRLQQQPDEDKNFAATQNSDTGTAITKTGDDAMSKFGHAIGALAEREEDFDDQALDYAAEIAEPSSKRDDAVAPHIAAAERELEQSKSSGPMDIFDRIAQAAESQFDESRGSTTKRVSELVDDRRVGTKRWTPSKTMKERMEKLEAARAAAGEPTRSSSATAPAADEPAVTASAPSSSTATTVTPGSKPATPEEAKAQPEAVVETAREGAAPQQPQPEPEAAAQTEGTDADTGFSDFDDENTDTLRVIPGARGRRRDRARKTRLDEDFEKIFDDEGKPSINSLRRKLRSTANAEAEAAAAEQSSGGANDPSSASSADGEPKKGLFSRLLQSKNKKAVVPSVEEGDLPEFDHAETGQIDPALQSDDDLVAAFETPAREMDENLVIDPSVDENWEEPVFEKRKQNKLAMPIIGTGAAIALAGIGFFAYRFFFG